MERLEYQQGGFFWDAGMVLPGLVVKSKEIDEVKELIESIASLKEEMMQLGYNPGEVNYLIKKYANTEDDKEIDHNTLLKIHNSLKGHIHMAQKCMNIK